MDADAGEERSMQSDLSMPLDARPLQSSEVQVIDAENGYCCVPSRTGPVVVRLDPIGLAVWDLLDGTTPLSAIAADLAAALGSPTRDLQRQLTTFVGALLHSGLVSIPNELPYDEMDLPDEGPPFTVDFIMTPYPVDVDPTGRPTSLEILRAAAGEGTVERQAWDRIVEALRSEIGSKRSVWGMKLVDGVPSWELYFCAHDRPYTPELAPLFESVRRGFARVGNWTAPREVTPTSGMASFEFDIRSDGTIDGPSEMDIYPPADPDMNVWVNYRLDGSVPSLRNTYQSHELPSDRDGLIEWFRVSRFATPQHPDGGSTFWLDRISDLRNCVGTWCAQKPKCDGIYLRRTHVDDLSRFLHEFDYPGPLRQFVDDHLRELDHLRFELSFDFIVDDGRVEIQKTGFYGYF